MRLERTMRPFLAALSLTLLLGCDDGNSNPPADTSNPDMGGEDTSARDVPEVIGIDLSRDDTQSSTDAQPDTGPTMDLTGCDEVGFAVVAFDQRANLRANSLFYLGVAGSTEPTNWLTIEFYYNSGDALREPGTRELAATPTESNYGTCSTCVTLLEDCESSSCDSAFFPTEGTLIISELSDVDAPFSGELRNVRLQEVAISGGTSTPLPGGRTWCIPSYTWTTTMMSDP